MKILIAEDNAVCQLVLKRLLTQWGHEVIVTADGNAAWEILKRKDAPPIAILDWLMPGMDGVDLCRKVRSESEAPFVYLVLLTGKTRQEDIIQGIDSGADDYLSKPFNHQELRVRLRAGQRIVELHQDLLEQATRDALTGLWNRKTILEILQNELMRAARNQEPVGVVMADIDHFKRINDTLGHPVGDAVLRDVSSVLRASLRPLDAVGRYGGEEFLIVLPGCDEESTRDAAERIRQIVVSGLAPQSGINPVTMSLGIASSGSRVASAENLIKTADDALYLAKKNGRNRVEPGPRDLGPHFQLIEEVQLTITNGLSFSTQEALLDMMRDADFKSD